MSVKEEVAHEFDTSSSLYAQFTERVHSDVAQKLLEYLPKDQMTLVDIGTGNGVAAIAAALKLESKGLVVGIDISEKMLVEAKKNLLKTSLANVEFIAMEASASSFRSNCADAVLGNITLPFLLLDWNLILREIHRILKTGGGLYFSGFQQPSQAWMILQACLKKHATTNPSDHLLKSRKIGAFLVDLNNGYPSWRWIGDELRSYGFDIKLMRSETIETVYPSATICIQHFEARSSPEFNEITSEAKSNFRREATKGLSVLETLRGLVEERILQLLVATKNV